MLYIIKLRLVKQSFYDDIEDVLIKFYWGFIFPVNKKPSKGYFIDRKFTRTSL